MSQFQFRTWEVWNLFYKWAINGLFFFIYIFSKVQLVEKIFPMSGSLVSLATATALPTEPQPLHPTFILLSKNIYLDTCSTNACNIWHVHKQVTRMRWWESLGGILKEDRITMGNVMLYFQNKSQWICWDSNPWPSVSNTWIVFLVFI